MSYSLFIVGSICEVNNAQVAAALGMDAICVAPGGLGSSFDQLALNREMLRSHGVNLKVLSPVRESLSIEIGCNIEQSEPGKAGYDTGNLIVVLTC